MSPGSLKSLLLVASVAVLALLSAACEKDQDAASWWQGEQERIGLSHQLELKKFRFEQVSSRDFQDLERLRELTAESVSRLPSLRQQRQTLGTEVESLEGQRVETRQAAIREHRQRAIGKTFQALDLVSGRKFRDVSVSAIDDAGVTIRHADGSARLRHADLDFDQRALFGLEADLALAAEDKEARDTAAYDRWIDTRLALVREQETKATEIARREVEASQRERSLLAARQLAASNARPLAQAATSVGSRSWSSAGTYSNYRSYRPTYRYVYHYDVPSNYNTCRPVLPIQPGRIVRPSYISPTAFPQRKSFADTTIPSIP